MTWPLRSAVTAYIDRAPSPAHAMLAVALASYGARLRRTHVEHDGRRLRVAICDAPKGPGEVTASLVMSNPMRAALDVLVACREYGLPLDRRRARARPRIPPPVEKIEKKVAPTRSTCKRRNAAPPPCRAGTPLLPKGGES